MVSSLAVNSARRRPAYLTTPPSPQEAKAKISRFTITTTDGSKKSLRWSNNGDIFYTSAVPRPYCGFMKKQVSPSVAKDILFHLVTTMNKGDKIDIRW